jgi:hypothetical protein
MSNDLSRPLMLENLNVDTVKVHIPKEIDGTDMGTWAWWFVYLNAKKEKYSIPMTLELTTTDEGEEEYTSDVTMNHGITGKHGQVSYAIEAIQADGSGTITGEWHTKTCKEEIVYTLQGNQTQYDESESDIISALISRVNELIQSGAEIAEIAATIEAAAGTAQEVIDSIPADYSELSAQVDTNTEDISGLKADLDSYIPIKPSTAVRSFDMLPDSNRIGEHTSNGITFTVSDDGKTVEATGTSTAPASALFSIQILKGSSSVFPNDFKRGKTYTMRFETSDSGIYANVWCKKADGTTTVINSNSGELTFSVPTDATALAVRVLVYRLTTVDGALTDISYEEVITHTLSPSGNVADRTNEILARLVAFGYCKLEPGIFYVENLQMPENCTLEGCGKNTIVRLSADSDAKYAIATNTETSIFGMCIEGTTEDIILEDNINIERYGIYHVANYGYGSGDLTTKLHVQLGDLTIRRFSGAGVYQYHTGTPVDSGLVVTNCRIRNCNIGIYIKSSSEYCKYVGVDITSCYYGFFNQGSSNIFDSGSISRCYVGFKLVNYGAEITDNIGHNIISNTTLNHFFGSDGTANTGICIDMTTAFSVTFEGCNMAFGSINLTSCQGIIFSSVQFGNRIPVNVSGGKTILFIGCITRVSGEPEFTITGAPIIASHGNYSRTGDPWEQNT